VAEWEPGDDICPPWIPWHGPRPNWWNEKLTEVGQQAYIGLVLVNVAARVQHAETSVQIARIGASMVHKSGEELNGTIARQ
jgi:hypothetical protein